MSIVGIKNLTINLIKFMNTDKFKKMSESEKLNFGYRAVSSGTTLEVKKDTFKEKKIIIIF